MSIAMNENLGTVEYDNLINSANPPADVFGVDVVAGQGTLARGTVLVKTDAGMKVISAANKAETLTQTLPVINGHVIFVKGDLDITTLKIYKADGTAAAETTDYTAAYSDGMLDISIVAETGALKDDAAVKFEIDDTEGYSANCVLANELDTGDDAGDALTGVANRTGHFNSNKLIVADGYTLTSDDKETLRGVGILLSEALTY